MLLVDEESYSDKDNDDTEIVDEKLCNDDDGDTELFTKDSMDGSLLVDEKLCNDEKLYNDIVFPFITSVVSRVTKEA